MRCMRYKLDWRVQFPETSHNQQQYVFIECDKQEY